MEGGRWEYARFGQCCAYPGATVPVKPTSNIVIRPMGPVEGRTGGGWKVLGMGTEHGREVVKRVQWLIVDLLVGTWVLKRRIQGRARTSGAPEA